MANIRKYIAKRLGKKSASQEKTKVYEVFGCGCCSPIGRFANRECVQTRIYC